MDISDEETLCHFGTPLEPLDKDEVPTKKPIAIEDQIVTDENGKRRFHGAFTGGFSAGFWNTVGSLEGWKPQSFKSSRSEKAEKRQSQLPTDFMDDEDLGEFGIAPQRIQARDDFVKDDKPSLNRKRKWNTVESGPIPGIPLLQQLLEPTREKVAIRLLRKMGWKPGQGIGARQTKTEKSRSNKRNNKEIYLMKMYGCTLPDNSSLSKTTLDETDELSEEEIDEAITFAPDDFEQSSYTIKDNTFGLGYSGLERGLSGKPTTHINLFASLDTGKDNKQLRIMGQAFGVGALEEEDEDIYAKDDMSNYDFSLNRKEVRKVKQKVNTHDENVLAGFTKPFSKTLNLHEAVHRIDLKSNFHPRNWLTRRTRFEPLPKTQIQIAEEESKTKHFGHRKLDPDKRRDILDKDRNSKPTRQEDKTKEPGKDSNERFVKAITQCNLEEDVRKENQTVLAGAKQLTEVLGSKNEVFRPFASNEEKQNRYDMFIKADPKSAEAIKSFFDNIQPIHLSDWEKEREQKEFIQARNIYKPLAGLMLERFVSKRTSDHIPKCSEVEKPTKIKVSITRKETFWKPSSLICKRFNVPDPHGSILDEPKVTKKKNKFSVFDYMESSVNSKKNFVTPVIIPKRLENPTKIGTLTDSTKINENTSDPTPSATIRTDSKPALPSNNTVTEAVTELPSKRKSEAPKTELEIQIEESRHKHPSEKKDIFKRIFDFSSDEDQNDKELEVGKSDEMPKVSVPSNVITALIKPSIHNNILRNNSPPRGIFASMFSQQTVPIATEKKEIKSESVEHITFRPRKERANEADNVYGPRLPENPIAVSHIKPMNQDYKQNSSRHGETAQFEYKWIEKASKKRSKEKEHKKKKNKHTKKSKKHKDKK